MRTPAWVKAFRASPDDQSLSTSERAQAEQLVRWQKALKAYPYPYEIVPGTRGEEALASERENGRRNGYVPLLFVPAYWNVAGEIFYFSSREARAKKAANYARDMLSYPEFTAEYGKQWLADRYLGMMEEWDETSEVPSPDRLFDNLRPIELSALTPRISLLETYIPSENKQKIWDEVAIVRLPAASAAEFPAYLSWGGWNNTPSDLEILAVARYWHEAYGAELVAISSDVLEFEVKRPPRDHPSAVALIKEHYAFAPEGYDQFGGDQGYFEEEVARLQMNRYWRFWWD